jgi:hypothetical protein
VTAPIARRTKKTSSSGESGKPVVYVPKKGDAGSRQSK